MQQHQKLLPAALALFKAAGVVGQAPTATSNPLNDFIDGVHAGAGAINSAISAQSSSPPASSSSSSSAAPSAAPATSSAPPPPGHGLSNGAKIGIIVGCVIGALLLIGFLIGICCCLMRRKRRRRADTPVAEEEIKSWKSKPTNPGRDYSRVASHGNGPSMEQHPTVPLIAAGAVPHGSHSQAPSLSRHPAMRDPIENPFADNAYGMHHSSRNSHHGLEAAAAGATAAGAAGYGMRKHSQSGGYQPVSNASPIAQNQHHGLPPGVAAATVGGAAGHDMHHLKASQRRQPPNGQMKPGNQNGLGSQPGATTANNPLNSLPSATNPSFIPNNGVKGAAAGAAAAGAVGYGVHRREEKARSGRESHSRSRSHSHSRQNSGTLPTHNGPDRPPTPFGLSGIGQPYEVTHVHHLQSEAPSRELRRSLQNREEPSLAAGLYDDSDHARYANSRGHATPPRVPARSPHREKRPSTFADSSYDSSLSNGTGSASSSSGVEQYQQAADPYRPAHPNRGAVVPWEHHQPRYSGTTPPASATINPPPIPWEHGDYAQQRRHSHSPRGSRGSNGFTDSSRRSSGSPAATSINGQPRRFRFDDLHAGHGSGGHPGMDQRDSYDAYEHTRWSQASALAQSTSSCTVTLTPTKSIKPSVASGYQAAVVATGLSRPRSIQFDLSGNLLVVQAGTGISSLQLQDNGGTCVGVRSQKSVVQNKGLNHGLALSQDGKTLYASTPEAAYSWDYDSAQSTVSRTNRTVVSGMNTEDHTTRTLLMSQKEPGMLLISRGSTSNVDLEAESLSSGHSQIRAFNLTNMTADPYSYNTDGIRIGWGLRNSVGVVEHPDTGGIYSVENSVDQLMRQGKDIHEDNPGEEMNFHGYLNGTEYAPQGSNYGYPHCFAAWVPNDIPDNSNLTVGSQFAMGDQNSTINDTYCAGLTPPRLTFQAHMAPLDIKFNNPGTEAWVTFHGSWDRTDPSGYKLSMIPFAGGEPVARPENNTSYIDIFANADNANCPDNCFRPVGLAMDDQGRLFMSSDASGEIYVIVREQSVNGTSEGASGDGRAAGGETSDAIAHSLHEHIATYLGSDKDICTYTLICPEAHNAVHSYSCVVWKATFAKRYDVPPGKTGKDLMLLYMTRRMALWMGSRKGFHKGHTADEVRCMDVLRDLIVESYANTSVKQRGKPTSNNLESLLHFVKASNLLENIVFGVHRSDHQSRFLQTIQLLLTHWQLDLSIRSRAQGFGYSQQIVYGHPAKVPMFFDRKGTVNVEYLLHIVNFFKYHMKTETENTLYPLLCDLSICERPGAWDSQLSQVQGVKKLGSHWKGSYAYMPELADVTFIRSMDQGGLNLDSPIADAIDYDDGFQTLNLDFSRMVNHLSWPAVFEQHLHGLPPNPLCRRLEQCFKHHHHQRLGSADIEILKSPLKLEASLQPNPSIYPSVRRPDIPTAAVSEPGPKPHRHYIQFSGSGKDYGPFHCTGILHNLPPQFDIPGWQRVTLMKYLVQSDSISASLGASSSPSPTFSATSSILSASSNASGMSAPPSDHAGNPFGYHEDGGDDEDVMLDEHCWCYEGVVLPGGKIILGRWWQPLEEGGEQRNMGPFIFWNVPDDEERSVFSGQ
ncbi:MAG: hypothetical protein Q9163_003281 [Psora crenata]